MSITLASVKYTIEKTDDDVFDLEEVKNYLRISSEHDNVMVISIINAAILYAENFTGLSFRRKYIEVKIERLLDCVSLRYFPILKIEELTLLDNDNSEKKIYPKDSEIEKDAFAVDEHRSSILFDRELIGRSVKIRYIAGYEKIPADVKNAMLIYASHLYDSYTVPPNVLNAINNIYIRYRVLKI